MKKKYSKSLHILLTPEQHKKLRAVAKSRKLSIGSLIRLLMQNL